MTRYSHSWSIAVVAMGMLSLGYPPVAESGPIDDLQPGHWYEAPNTHLRPLVPVPTPPGATGPIAIMGGWSGGAYDTRRDRLIVWGGGHGDYAGNELYAFDIHSLTWSRIWGPTPNDQIIDNCIYSDGNPASRHTYGSLTYLPIQDRFWAQGGSHWQGGGDCLDTWEFDLRGLSWERKADVPTCGSCGSLQKVAAYDPATGHVFLGAAEGWPLREYDPVANTYTNRSNDPLYYHQGGAIDTKRRKFVTLGSGYLIVYDLNTSGLTARQLVTTTGDTEVQNERYPGVAYDPVSDRIVAWTGGANVYTLNMDTMVWTRHATTGSVIPTDWTYGVFGRFQYIPSKNAFIAVNHIDENVYFYKLSPGNGAPTDSIPPSAPTNVTAN